jgi:archaemetzincin
MEINKRLFWISITLSLISLVWFINTGFGKDDEDKLMNKEMITLVPLGSIDKGELTTLASSLGEVFGLPVSIEPLLKLPSSAYHERRQQYHATTILDRVRMKTSSGKGRRLGIVDVDLYVPELNFVFGEADIFGKAAIISLYRLRQEFYGFSSNRDLFLKRTLKESVHELGHTFGLRHCRNEKCVMYFSNSLMDTDRKQATFCPACRKKLP